MPPVEVPDLPAMLRATESAVETAREAALGAINAAPGGPERFVQHCARSIVADAASVIGGAEVVRVHRAARCESAALVAFHRALSAAMRAHDAQRGHR